MIGNTIKEIMKNEGIGLKNLMDSINKGKVVKDTPQNVLGKLSRDTIRFIDVEEILNAIGYHIEIKKNVEVISNNMKKEFDEILVTFSAIQQLIKRKTGLETQIVMTDNKEKGSGLFFFIDKNVKVSKVDYMDTADGDTNFYALDSQGKEISFDKIPTLLSKLRQNTPTSISGG